MNKTCAKLHAILPRKGDKAVVFRRGPSSCVAVIGWDLAKDTFTIGQWLRGRIYHFRCDLSPDGEYLLYFAAKYGNVNPVEKFVNDKVIERIGEPFYGSIRSYEKYFQQREREEELVRKEFAKEIQKIRNGRDYTDRSWTAISRAPYLKALDLWFNGPVGDCGTTGRKLAVDFYGGNCVIGGGSPWTKDGTKADLSLNLLARARAVSYIQEHPDCPEVHCAISCRIGSPEILVVFTDKTGNELLSYRENVTPAEVIREFKLQNPRFAEMCRKGIFT